MMGHEHLETTQVYIHVSLAQAHRVYNRTHDFCLMAQAADGAGGPAPAAVPMTPAWPGVSSLVRPAPQPRHDTRTRTLVDQLFDGEARGAD
jgi:hypothetical protein